MSNGTNWRKDLLARHHWVTFLLPFVVYMIVTVLEPAPGGNRHSFARIYPWMYAVKIALTVAAVAFVWPGYRQFAPRLSPLAVLVGVVGGPLWIALCLPNWEQIYLMPWIRQVGLEK